ncbi:hypothetical protein CBL_01648 [Carabus blaptoides fortunei]
MNRGCRLTAEYGRASEMQSALLDRERTKDAEFSPVPRTPPRIDAYDSNPLATLQDEGIAGTVEFTLATTNHPSQSAICDRRIVPAATPLNRKKHNVSSIYTLDGCMC